MIRTKVIATRNMYCTHLYLGNSYSFHYYHDGAVSNYSNHMCKAHTIFVLSLYGYYCSCAVLSLGRYCRYCSCDLGVEGVRHFGSLVVVVVVQDTFGTRTIRHWCHFAASLTLGRGPTKTTTTTVTTTTTTPPTLLHVYGNNCT